MLDEYRIIKYSDIYSLSKNKDIDTNFRKNLKKIFPEKNEKMYLEDLIDTYQERF